MSRLLNRVRWALAQGGVTGALRLAVGRLRGRVPTKPMVHPFDWEHGVETSGLIDSGALATSHPNARYGTAYFGVPPSRMRRLLARWVATPPVRPLEEYVFVDIGCGKGRALLLASELPFRQVLGVEIDASIAGVAKANVTRWKALGRMRCPARVLCGDATETELPDGPLLVYFYNPFRAPVLRGLLRRLADRGGAIDVIYLYPEEDAVFAEFPDFEVLWSEGIGLDAEDVGVDEISSPEDPCTAYRLRT